MKTKLWNPYNNMVFCFDELFFF